MRPLRVSLWNELIFWMLMVNFCLDWYSSLWILNAGGPLQLYFLLDNQCLTRHVEMNRTTKRQKCKSEKGITSVKNKDLLMLCKKGLIPKQHHAFFDSLTVTTSGGKKDDLIQTVILTVRKMNLLIHIKIGQNLH